MTQRHASRPGPRPGLRPGPKIRFVGVAVVGSILTTTACEAPDAPTDSAYEDDDARWLAGDHHIHSRFSVGWDREQEPPRPILGGDGTYAIPINALMARQFGLSWMVSTDHGGPNHSRISLGYAYPELTRAREAVPGVIQFFGMEFDTPGADHSSLIVPHSHDEAETLHAIESTFSKYEPWPPDDGRDTETRMLEALRAMRAFPERPVLIANHPSRSAPGPGQYGLDTPAQLRDWNDTAPEVAVGMSGAPGHQASTLRSDGSPRPDAARGNYSNHPTHGGFDQMTARLGGFWDSMLGEGRRWWITANSDSHFNWREGGTDFWPGEYSKTYVWAEKSHDAILEGLRRGRVFVATGDLVSELDVAARRRGSRAGLGETLVVGRGSSVEITVRFLDPAGPNASGREPSVHHVDLIAGDVTGPLADRDTDVNPTTRVVARWQADEWRREGAYAVAVYTLHRVEGAMYVRVRGTNGREGEPSADPRGENPWTDLWFYSNPVFIDVR